MNRIVIYGAGSAQFGATAIGDILQSAHLKGSQIVLVDINKQALSDRKDQAEAFVEKHALDFKITATSDSSAALKGADHVLISIEAGDRFKLWDIDWHMPQQFGVGQIFGENGGVGGLLHALRVCPPVLKICEEISEVAPDAYVFVFSNPLSRICTTITRAFPDLNVIGMCHEIASIERYVPDILGRDFDSMHLRCGGLNHFSVLVESKCKNSGADLYPDILAKSEAFFENLPGYSEIFQEFKDTGRVIETETALVREKGKYSKSFRAWSDRRVFKEIIKRFKLFPITTDSHLGEYLPWASQIADHKGIIDFYDYYRTVLGTISAEIQLICKERFVPIIEGLIGAGDYEEPAVNIPNTGHLIADLPEWLTVEVPGKISKGKVEGVKLDIPASFRGLLTNQVGIHNMVAQAVIEKSKETALQAILIDPTIGVVRDIDNLLDLAIARQAPYLDYLK